MCDIFIVFSSSNNVHPAYDIAKNLNWYSQYYIPNTGYSNHHYGNFLWRKFPQHWAYTFVFFWDLNYFSFLWNSIVLRIFRDIDKLLVYISLYHNYKRWWAHTEAWISPAALSRETGPTGWPGHATSCVTTVSELGWAPGVPGSGHLFTSENFVPKSVLLAFPLVTLCFPPQVSTSLIKGEKPFIIGHNGVLARKLAGQSVHRKRSPGTGPGRFSVNETARQIPLRHGGKGHIAWRSCSQQAPLLYVDSGNITPGRSRVCVNG